jgi:hypothetical protein
MIKSSVSGFEPDPRHDAYPLGKESLCLGYATITPHTTSFIELYILGLPLEEVQMLPLGGNQCW